MAIKWRKRIIVIVVCLIILAIAVAAALLILSGSGGDSETDLDFGKPAELVMPAGSDLGSTKTAPDSLGEHKLVAENNNYALYLFEDTVSIKVLNKASGAILESTLSEENDDGSNNRVWNAQMQSGINITAIKGQTEATIVDLIGSKNTVDVTYIQNGFSAKLFFTKYKFGLTMNVTLDGDSIVASVPAESIIEQTDGTYIGTVMLFPFLGYTHIDDKEGYMFVPDGNGALIYLNDKEKRYTSGFSQMIYGNDRGFEDSLSTGMWEDYVAVNNPEQVIAPIFGMVHKDDAFGYLGIVEKGEERASIEAQPNGAMINYNRCYAKFYVRRLYVQPLNNSNSGTISKAEENRLKSDLQVRYMLVSGEEADYAGMAVKYRDYLFANDMLEKKDTAYNTRVDFLGSEREKWLVFTSAVEMTTTDNITAIYDELEAAGVKSLLSVYKGWQDGGLYNFPIDDYEADSCIGGTSELTRLIKDSESRDYKLYLYNNALVANPDETNTTFNTIKKINKRRLEVPTYGMVYPVFNYLLPGKTEKTLSEFLESCKNKEISRVCLAGISDSLFSYSYNSVPYSRTECEGVYYRTVRNATNAADVVLEHPFSYLWKQTDAFLDMPLESSHYMYLDEEVPFMSIVLKGTLPMYSDYVNFEANKKEFFLKMVEAGVYPSFYLSYRDSSELLYTNSAGLYSTQYETYKDTIIEYDKALRETAEAVGDSFITEHEKLSNGVTKVTYSNQAVIYINYTQSALVVDGYTVEGMSYAIGRSTEAGNE